MMLDFIVLKIKDIIFTVFMFLFHLLNFSASVITLLHFMYVSTFEQVLYVFFHGALTLILKVAVFATLTAHFSICWALSFGMGISTVSAYSWALLWVFYISLVIF